MKGVEGRVNVDIVDVSGRMLRSFVKDCPAECEMVIDVEGLAKGSYVVRLYNQQFDTTRKFSVQ